MANIRQRKNGSYIVEVFLGRNGSGQKITKAATFTPDPKKSERQNQKALQAFALEFEKKAKSGTAAADSLTFESFAREWMESYVEKELEPTTLDNYQTALDRLYPRIGFMKLSALRPSVITKTISDLREGGYTDQAGKPRKYSEVTLRHTRRVLSTVLSAAVEDGLLQSNPCNVRQRKNKAERQETPEISCFTPEQAIYFLNAIEKPIPIMIEEHTVTRCGNPVKIRAHICRYIDLALKYRVIFNLAVYGGFRRGEIIGLTWENIDFQKSTVRVRQAAHYTPKAGQYDGNAKNNYSYREIYLPAAVMSLLKSYKKEQAREIMLKGTAWTGDRTQTTGHLFTQEDGRTMHVGTPNAEFTKIIRLLNKTLDEENQLPTIHLHDLRHTSASILIAEGLDPVTVAHRLGHSDATTTLRIYAHSFGERDRDASDAIEKALSKFAKG